mmetsp:Transcript_56103/g.64022  ORF Transcript_56103/g.64022 Transcript_56103/m.64022 type:complete len:167 (+) Transcript_56103:185-685(+)
MDCLFNKCIPKSTPTRVCVHPMSKTWINGIASSYSEDYPEELREYIDEKDYGRAISQVNDTLITYWPCSLCFSIGYVCALCTAGLSFCFPYCCISDAEKLVNETIRDADRNIFRPKGLSIELKKKCSTSWLEINIQKSHHIHNDADEGGAELQEVHYDLKEQVKRL